MKLATEDNAGREFINVSVRLRLSPKAFEKLNALRDDFGLKTRTEVVQRLLEELFQD